MRHNASLQSNISSVAMHFKFEKINTLSTLTYGWTIRYLRGGWANTKKQFEYSFKPKKNKFMQNKKAIKLCHQMAEEKACSILSQKKKFCGGKNCLSHPYPP